MPEAPSIRATVAIGAEHLHTKSVWGGSLPVAAMGKVPVGDRAGVGLVLHGVFPILTFFFPPIDFAGTMKKVRLLCVPGNIGG